jgi:cytosine/creatinine deaminase
MTTTQLQPYTSKSPFEERIREHCDEFGGIKNVHIHGDRAFTREDRFYAGTGKSVAQLGDLTLSAKQELTWALHEGEAFTPESIELRMRRLFDESIKYGVTEIWTTVDVTYNTKLKSLEVALKLKEEYSEKGLKVMIGAYNPSGFRANREHRDRMNLFEDAASQSDFLMGLAEKDRKLGHIGESTHNLDLLSLAAELKKPVHFHVGQENRPTDDTLELLLDCVDHYMDDDVVPLESVPQISVVHAISTACKSDEEIEITAKRMKDRDIGLICCPRAAISMLQDRTMTAPIHNSIGPLFHFAMQGVRIEGLGVDNLFDIYIPASSPDVYDEVEDLANALRFYDERILAKIACGKPLDNFDRSHISKMLFNGKQ